VSAVSNPPGDGASPISFAVVSGLPQAERYLAAMCDALGRALSRTVSPRVLPTYAALAAEVEAGRAQLAWAPPLLASELEDRGLATIELCCTRGGQSGYHAALFTRHASPVEVLADLAGRHAAWVDEHSSAGYLLPRMKLAAEGLHPETLFGKETFLGTHARVARAVLEGEADVGATYLSLDPETGRPVSAGWLDAGAGINGAFILLTAGPIPADAIVVSRALPDDLKEALVEQVKALPSTSLEPMGRLLGADGFDLPRASHFDALRALAVKRNSIAPSA
jgi:phosphonate transport system substrate-binding protein